MAYFLLSRLFLNGPLNTSAGSSCFWSVSFQILSSLLSQYLLLIWLHTWDGMHGSTLLSFLPLVFSTLDLHRLSPSWMSASPSHAGMISLDSFIVWNSRVSSAYFPRPCLILILPRVSGSSVESLRQSRLNPPRGGFGKTASAICVCRGVLL